MKIGTVVLSEMNYLNSNLKIILMYGMGFRLLYKSMHYKVDGFKYNSMTSFNPA